jgi:hypothetical protein
MAVPEDKSALAAFSPCRTLLSAAAACSHHCAHTTTCCEIERGISKYNAGWNKRATHDPSRESFGQGQETL